MVNGVVTIPLSGQPLDGHLPERNGHPPPAALEFFAGPENCLVEPAILGILGKRLTPFNPLVLYGPSGTGKSHLARGIAATWKANYPQNRVAYTSAVDFAREMSEAFEAQSVEDFRRKYRAASLAVFEDIGQLAAKPAAQEELICTLDATIQRGGQVASDGPSGAQENSRTSPGFAKPLCPRELSLPLAPPGRTPAGRSPGGWTSLQRFNASWLIRSSNSWPKRLAGTVPELLGAMLQLEVPAQEAEPLG